MSDTRPYGEPVDDPVVTDPDVAARANEGLADAEAAREGEPAVWTPEAAERAEAEAAPDRTEAAPTDTWTTDGSAPATDTWGSDPSSTDAAAPAPRLYDAEPATTAADDDVYVPGSYSTRLYDDPATTPAATPAAEAETVVVAPVVAEPVRQPIFVQAPEAPIAKGNRAAAGAIGLLAAVVFAILYLGVALGLGALTGAVTGDTLVPFLLTALASWTLWVPTAVFFLAFWLLGAIVNRGRWGAWVVVGLLVGVAAYGGHIAGVLFQAPFWTLTAREGGELAETELLAPLAIAAFVIGRELTIWFGAWVARRGRRVTELNAEAQREYERTLEAGPKLYAS